jgi:hypothetical protein
MNLLVRRWLKQYRLLANDGADGGTKASEGSVGVTTLGVAALSCFIFAITMNGDCSDKLESL